MDRQKMQWLIATDLDGTLLDDTYPWANAAQVLDQVQAFSAGTLVALASSKTLVEMLEIDKLVDQPLLLIFENGGGVAWPQGLLVRNGQMQVEGFEVVKFTLAYEKVCTVLQELRQRGFEFQGFADMTAGQVAAATGLSISAASRARQRMSSEPILWQGSAAEFDEFSHALHQAGLSIVRGGRFHHVSSGASKALAIEYLRGQLRYERGLRPRVLACGDAPNDLEMIDNADSALIFPDRNGGYLREKSGAIDHAPLPGPKHWLSGVRKIVERAEGVC